MADLQEFKDHFILLCEAGFIAVNQANEDAAKKLFNASSILKPENTLPKVGHGYMHLMKLELQQACKCFDEVLTKEPDNEMAKALLGLSYTLTADGVAKGEKLLSDTSKGAKDDQVKLLAETSLDFVENFIKKPSSPLDPTAKKPKNPEK